MHYPMDAETRRPEPISIPEGIVGMCFMHDAQHLVMVYASGYVRIWKGEEIVLEWMLPAGSPRSVAAHPSEPLLAIGCKGPGQVWVYQVDVQRQSG